MYRCIHCHKLWSEQQLLKGDYPLLRQSVRLCPSCKREAESLGAEVARREEITSKEARGLKSG